jgi:DNA-binding NarL/FixJ family response regulator
MMSRRPTIFLAGDHSRFCERLAASLRQGFDIAGTAFDVPGAISGVARSKPDVVVLDVSMPLHIGIDAALRMRESAPSSLILFIDVNDEADAETQVLPIGSVAFLLRIPDPSESMDAIRTLLDDTAAAGPSFAGRERAESDLQTMLTTREKEVVGLLAQGKLMKQVADLLNVSTRTVAFHKYGVMRKLGLHSSAELVRMAVSEGLVA